MKRLSAMFSAVLLAGFPLLGSSPDAQAPTAQPGQVQSASINANGDTGLFSLYQATGGAIQFSGTFVGTLQFEATINGTTWNALSVTPTAGGAAVTSATATGSWTFTNLGYAGVRVRASAWTSGNLIAQVTTAGPGVTAAGGLFGDGSAGGPSVAIGESTSGWYRAAANDIRAAVNGSDVIRLISGGIAIFPTQVRVTNNAGSEQYFSGDTQDSQIASDASIDVNIDLDQDAIGSSTFRVRSGGANLFTVHDFNVIQIGNDAASPATQELKSADSTGGTGSTFLIKSGESAGSNIAGGTLQLAGGQGTGTGAGGSVDMQVAPAGSSGSSVNAHATTWSFKADRTLQSVGLAFASLPAASNGAFIYCTDCTFANPCAAGGTGAFAKRLNGVWRCD